MVTPQKTFVILADFAHERKQWLKALQGRVVILGTQKGAVAAKGVAAKGVGLFRRAMRSSTNALRHSIQDL